MNEFDKLFEGIEETPGYLTAHAINDFVLDLEKLMRERGVTRARLAERLGVSRAHVTQLLRSSSNFTVETMVGLVSAVGGSLHIKIENGECEDEHVDWSGHAANRNRGEIFSGETLTADNYHAVDLSEDGFGYDSNNAS